MNKAWKNGLKTEVGVTCFYCYAENERGETVENEECWLLDDPW